MRPVRSWFLSLVLLLAFATGCAPQAPAQPAQAPTQAPAQPAQAVQATPTAELAARPTQAATPAPAKADAKPPGAAVINVGLSNEPARLDPHVTTGTAGRTIQLLIYRGLYNYGKEGKLTPELAESYQVGEDRRTYTFKLRKATFHNGDPVTAEDVKFSIERILDEKTGATFRSLLAIVEKVEAVDAATVRITLKAPAAPFLHYLALPEVAIVSKKWVTEKGADFAAAPMGAGPYAFKEWKKGQSLVLEGFKEFYKPGLPKTPTIRYTFLAEENARVTALRGGDVDLIEYVPWKDIGAIEGDGALQLLSTKGPFMGLIFNTGFKPFSDPRVRQAIAYTIDRQAIIDTAFNGRGYPIFGLAMPSTSLAYDPKLDNYFKVDLEKAKALLKEAGYADGFKAKLLATSQYAFHQQTAVVVKSELAKIGIDLELDLPDWATRLQKGSKAEYDMTVIGTAGDITDPDFVSDYFASGSTRLNASPGFTDARIDELLTAGRAELDEAKRKAIYAELQQRALDLSPSVFLMWRDQSYAAKKGLQGFENLPGFLSFQSGITLEEAVLTK
jgi:glutathione transport system substrate-binding protein